MAFCYQWSNLLISAQLRAVETVKRVLSISLRPLHIMQWPFHITTAKLSRSKNLSQENVAGGAEHGMDCADYCDFTSMIAEGDADDQRLAGPSGSAGAGFTATRFSAEN
jgi:hypothetical protein